MRVRPTALYSHVARIHLPLYYMPIMISYVRSTPTTRMHTYTEMRARARAHVYSLARVRTTYTVRGGEFAPLEARSRVSVALSNVTCAPADDRSSRKISRGRERASASARAQEKWPACLHQRLFLPLLISARCR